jgi:hypothetical protein
MTTTASCIPSIAPVYNIALSLIVFYLLTKLILLRRKNKNVFIKPWKYLFAAVSIFVLEEAITIFKVFGYISDAIIPRWFNAVFELIIVALFVYMLIEQINHVGKNYYSE